MMPVLANGTTTSITAGISAEPFPLTHLESSGKKTVGGAHTGQISLLKERSSLKKPGFKDLGEPEMAKSKETRIKEMYNRFNSPAVNNLNL